MGSKSYRRLSDGAMVGSEEAAPRGVLRDGYVAAFSVHLCDGARIAGGRAILRDTAGAPVTLYDAATGGSMKLNEDLIAAIEREAASAGISVPEYVKHVLRYSFSRATLSGAADPNSPAAHTA